MKTSGASILLNDLKYLVSEFTVAELSDLLTQAGGSPIFTNFLKPIVAIIKEAASQALVHQI